jgi:hypothetical protein
MLRNPTGGIYMKSQLIAVLLVIGLPTICISSQTSSFHCPNGIVSVGDTKQEVAEKCGKPTGKNYTDVEPMVGSSAFKDRNSYSYDSHWTYDPGPNGFVYVIEFRGGKVRYIDNTERYGSR